MNLNIKRGQRNVLKVGHAMEAIIRNFMIGPIKHTKNKVRSSSAPWSVVLD